ncbi:Uncharacterised protein family Cys-rich [Plasmopara halstedii]|uniref:Uncharacterized protein family Cys-rich n=1 Tax=Plasmopara halstedii TaxID=4781 RepID=A0A0P1B091_PLAHL|nr:Uncharacterised protein family Cys-rich [Plasmopara halstedii]CEG48104.1 Uncharacterised protein family Cys-rich [Plasmopara halstedii]|eukprot:XP_024584473.1 Uncharacterised protein family Cys-rich [Plasmopara halstedii]
MEIDPRSTRAQFTNMMTPAEVASLQATRTEISPLPAIASEMDTPRGPEYIAGDGVPTGAWAAGLFDYFDNLVPNCCMVTFCPCVALAQLATRLGVAPYKMMLSLLVFASLVLTMGILVWAIAKETYHSVNELNNGTHQNHDEVADGTFVMIMLSLYMLLLGFICHLRTTTRKRFHLPGNALTDCLSSWCFPCCTVAQLRTHVRSYQPGNCTFGPPSVLQAYPEKSYAV